MRDVRTRRSSLRLLLSACVSLIAQTWRVSAASSVSLVSQPIDLGNVWSGTSVNFGAAADADAVVAAFYNSDRFLEVARCELGSGRVVSRALDNRFEGWDAHKNTVVKFFDDSSLHVLANMHDSPLVYFYCQNKADIDALRREQMIGRDEMHVTYPSFLQADRKLFFYYRDGASGSGVWFMNVYSKTGWKRVGELFAGGTKQDHVSAYPSNIVSDHQGYFHVAIVWRKTADVETNFRLTYSRTRDFKSWLTSQGDLASGPQTPDSGLLVDDPGPGAGLLNNERLVVTSSGTPIIFYTKYGTDKRSILVAALLIRETFKRVVIAYSKDPLELKGGGSLAQMPRFHVDVISNTLSISLNFPNEAPTHLFLDAETLLPAHGVALEHHNTSALTSAKKGLRGGGPRATYMTSEVEGNAGHLGWLLWKAQPTARDLKQSEQPASQLLFVPED